MLHRQFDFKCPPEKNSYPHSSHLPGPSLFQAENGIEDYTDRWKLAMIVHKYSDFIAYPIIYEGPAQEPVEKEQDGGEIKIESKTLNSMKPIWARTRSEASQSDFNEFYKRIAND
jgi:molecular chaperone HtpG